MYTLFQVIADSYPVIGMHPTSTPSVISNVGYAFAEHPESVWNDIA